MNWTDDWVGLPYVKQGRAREGCDCWGLLLMLQEVRFGRILPDPVTTMQNAARTQLEHDLRGLWIRIDPKDAKEGDGACFNVHGMPLHVGYVVDRRMMIHTEKSQMGSCLENWAFGPRRAHLEGIYRFAG